MYFPEKQFYQVDTQRSHTVGHHRTRSDMVAQIFCSKTAAHGRSRSYTVVHTTAHGRTNNRTQLHMVTQKIALGHTKKSSAARMAYPPI